MSLYSAVLRNLAKIVQNFLLYVSIKNQNFAKAKLESMFQRNKKKKLFIKSL